MKDLANIDEALDLCSRNENCMIVSDNTKWEPTVEYEYIFNDRSLDVSEHQRLALEWGGLGLASIHSEKENDIVHDLIRSFTGGRGRSTWIGGVRSTRNNNIFTRSWNDGTPFDKYTNWARREPNNAGEREDYVMMRADGKWNDLRGDGFNRTVTRPFWRWEITGWRLVPQRRRRWWGWWGHQHRWPIWELKDRSVTTTTWIPNNTLPAVYKRIRREARFNIDSEGLTYDQYVSARNRAIRLQDRPQNLPYEFMVEETLRTWEDHKIYALRIGYELASIENTTENEIVTGLIENLDDNLWIGGSRESGSSWEWCDGTKWTFENWNTGQRNAGGNENRLEITSNGKWNSRNRNVRLFAVYKRVMPRFFDYKKYHFWQRDNFGGLFSTYNPNEQQNIDLRTPHDLYHKVCFNRSDNVEKAGFNRDYPLTIQLNNTVEINGNGNPCPNNGMGNFNKSSYSISKDSLQQFVFPMIDNEDLRRVIREFVTERKDKYTGINNPDNEKRKYPRSFFPVIPENDEDKLIERIVDHVFEETKKKST